MNTLSRLLIISFVLLSFISCQEGDSSSDARDNFNRRAILDTWANDIIIPSYRLYLQELNRLNASAISYRDGAKTGQDLKQLQEVYVSARKLWQTVDMFEIGPAEAVSLRLRSNTYPIDEAGVLEHIETGIYHLELPSNIARQGFGTIEYLLFSDAVVSTNLATINYLVEVISTQLALTTHVVEEWESTYANSFIANDGVSATSSFNSYMNDNLFYYEKFLRAGKVGIPAGVFSGNPLITHVESKYDRGNDLIYLKAAFDAYVAFFRGEFDGLKQGPSIKDYLDYVAEQNGRESIAAAIESRIAKVYAKMDGINPDFSLQIEQDNIAFLELYDELQQIVILIKVDAFSALNVRVDFVDADGD